MRLRAIPLDDIIYHHQFVVLDTSVMYPECSDMDRINHVLRVKRALNKKNVFIPKGVANEMRRITSKDGSHIFYDVESKKVGPHTWSLACSFERYLISDAQRLGIVSENKPPNTDIKVAALACAFANAPTATVALLSGDRRLDELVHETFWRTRNGYPPGFPALLDGTIDTYFLIQSRAALVDYHLERESFQDFCRLNRVSHPLATFSQAPAYSL